MSNMILTTLQKIGVENVRACVYDEFVVRVLMKKNIYY